MSNLEGSRNDCLSSYCRNRVSSFLGHYPPRSQTREHYGRHNLSQISLENEESIGMAKIIDFGFSNYLTSLREHDSHGSYEITQIFWQGHLTTFPHKC